ncbi:amino acid ABC transporter substrate-binding protein [Streptococcus moroccensis]|uniref:Polar amino acid transport system substrate-binding protein n=1 Tax=Streptococcus moroccensis TaxID=1451356 RepID=A0ABT9YS41_9STRE|nr:amino acid ABC transporter substrate-binding protein [Streptococcus moroccensis]MDQ0222820.1 polar amino acid transport system substrate-binding protein [Streptococcus moroccensis]
MGKKTLWLGVTLAASFVLGACQSNPTAESRANGAKEVVVATAGDVRPFSYEEGDDLTGYDIEVLKAADELLADYQFTYKKTAWESIFIGLDSGHYQIAANNLSYTAERAEKYLYSLPIATNPMVMAVVPDSPITSLDDIGGKTTRDDTGTSTAQLVEEWSQAHSDNPSVVEYSGENVTKRLIDLEAGQFDYLIFDKVSIENIIREQELDLKVVEIETKGNPMNYFIFADDQNDLQEAFNQALQELYKTGKLEEISQEFFGGSYLPDEAELQ